MRGAFRLLGCESRTPDKIRGEITLKHICILPELIC